MNKITFTKDIVDENVFELFKLMIQKKSAILLGFIRNTIVNERNLTFADIVFRATFLRDVLAYDAFDIFEEVLNSLFRINYLNSSHSSPAGKM